jgi:hypothetical protein
MNRKAAMQVAAYFAERARLEADAGADDELAGDIGDVPAVGDDDLDDERGADPAVILRD